MILVLIMLVLLIIKVLYSIQIIHHVNATNGGHYVPIELIILMTLVHHLTELETYTPMTFNYLMKQEKDTGGNDVDGTWGNYTIQEGEKRSLLNK